MMENHVVAGQGKDDSSGSYICYDQGKLYLPDWHCGLASFWRSQVLIPVVPPPPTRILLVTTTADIQNSSLDRYYNDGNCEFLQVTIAFGHTFYHLSHQSCI